ncbi:hypothetical protein [Micromonospora humida]|uniref:hypothetical protein n=1 Tax=Micromonospora humida TaxID=2809018 RepID=UPI0034284E9F
MHYPKRPSPVVSALAGSVCTVGVIGTVVRGLETFTDITLHRPVSALAFILAVTCSIGGGIWVAWLIIGQLLRHRTYLAAELARAHAEKDDLATILQAVQSTDAQVEVNTVLLRKLQKAVDEQLGQADTQPLGRLHSINGGGAG